MGIQIGVFLIPYYGLCIAIGVIVAGLTGYIQVKKYFLDINDFIILAGMVAFGGIIGAKLLYLLVSLDEIEWSRLTEPSYLQSVMSGGFVFYGGLIGGLLVLIPCKKIFRIPIGTYVAYCMPCIPIVHGFGRLGCSFAGCCYGTPYNGVFSITYHNSLVAPNNISLFPVQLLEAFVNFIIAGMLLFYIQKKKNGKLYTLPLYLVMYVPVRFLLEYLRYDYSERGYIGIFSTSQWISIGLLLCVGIWFVLTQKRLPQF